MSNKVFFSSEITFRRNVFKSICEGFSLVRKPETANYIITDNPASYSEYTNTTILNMEEFKDFVIKNSKKLSDNEVINILKMIDAEVDISGYAQNFIPSLDIAGSPYTSFVILSKFNDGGLSPELKALKEMQKQRAQKAAEAQSKDIKLLHVPEFKIFGSWLTTWNQAEDKKVITDNYMFAYITSGETSLSEIFDFGDEMVLTGNNPVDTKTGQQIILTDAEYEELKRLFIKNINEDVILVDKDIYPFWDKFENTFCATLYHIAGNFFPSDDDDARIKQAERLQLTFDNKYDSECLAAPNMLACAVYMNIFVKEAEFFDDIFIRLLNDPEVLGYELPFKVSAKKSKNHNSTQLVGATLSEEDWSL
jgi:hypothetical protein